jgi:hypothetical protein
MRRHLVTGDRGARGVGRRRQQHAARARAPGRAHRGRVELEALRGTRRQQAATATRGGDEVPVAGVAGVRHQELVARSTSASVTSCSAAEAPAVTTMRCRVHRQVPSGCRTSRRWLHAAPGDRWPGCTGCDRLPGSAAPHGPPAGCSEVRFADVQVDHRRTARAGSQAGLRAMRSAVLAHSITQKGSMAATRCASREAAPGRRTFVRRALRCALVLTSAGALVGRRTQILVEHAVDVLVAVGAAEALASSTASLMATR